MRFAIYIVAFLLAASAYGTVVHPYSITMVHADIQDEKIRLSIRTNAEDLVYFHQLLFDSMFMISQQALRNFAERHAEIILKGFFILDEHENKLNSKISGTNFSSLQVNDMYSVMDLMKYPLHYTLEFALPKETNVLVFHQILSEAGIPAVSLLSVSANGHIIVENIQLSKDKPFSMLRHAMTAGMPSKADFMLSYLTLTDRKIIHEINMSFALLRSFIQFNVQDTAVLAIMKDFVAANSAVILNNVTVSPDVTFVDFQKHGGDLINDFSLVSIRIEYALREIPKDVSVTWEAFNWQVRWFKSLIDAFGEPAEHYFSRFQPTFRMKREMKIQKERP